MRHINAIKAKNIINLTDISTQCVLIRTVPLMYFTIKTSFLHQKNRPFSMQSKLEVYG